MGFSLIELLVAMSLGLGVVAMGLTTTQTVRNAYLHDVVRTQLEQDVRASLDSIGASIRQAGEGFTNAFPAIEVLDGAPGAPDEIVLRKEILSDEPSVCAAIVSGTARGNIFFTNATPTSGCAYSSNGANFTSWRNHRISKNGQALAYIFNTATKQGEFFSYWNEVNTGASYYLQSTVGTWANDYPVGTSQMYVLEEWRFRLNAGELELIENGDTNTPWDMAFGLSDLQIKVRLTDGTILDSFSRTNDWTQIEYVEVTLTGEDTFRKEPLTVSLTSRYFPRNVLSN